MHSAKTITGALVVYLGLTLLLSGPLAHAGHGDCGRFQCCASETRMHPAKTILRSDILQPSRLCRCSRSKLPDLGPTDALASARGYDKRDGESTCAAGAPTLPVDPAVAGRAGTRHHMIHSPSTPIYLQTLSLRF